MNASKQLSDLKLEIIRLVGLDPARVMGTLVIKIEPGLTPIMLEVQMKYDPATKDERRTP